jgi:hypothetical protein
MDTKEHESFRIVREQRPHLNSPPRESIGADARRFLEVKYSCPFVFIRG